MRDSIAFDAMTAFLEEGRPWAVPVHGTSMHPFLKAGDSVHLCKVSPEHLRLGDIIAFRREDRLIVHRFAGRVRQDQVTWLRQKGDNLPGFSLILPENLMGRVAFVITAPKNQRHSMLAGLGLLRNRLLGLRAQVICLALECRQNLVRRFRGVVAP